MPIVGRVPPSAVAWVVAATLALLTPDLAAAVIPQAPPDGFRTTATPTFSWTLEPGEQAQTIELSPNPAPGEGGAFAEDAAKRFAVLAEPQTSYRVGNREPLAPGVWFWHVSTLGPDFELRWSVLRRIVVPDEPIVFHSLRLTYLHCIRTLSVEIDYSDNSAGQPARYRMGFRRHRHGREVASIRGRAVNGHVFRIFHKPRKLAAGFRYYVQLKLRDRAGHVTRSRLRRLLIARC
jgi:hypothetical protein